MTVTSNTTRNDYVAGTNQNVYNYTFQLNEANDVTVYLGGVVQTLNTHYTVQNVGVGTGGTITFTLVDGSNNPIFPTAGTAISIVMAMDLDRDTDYQANGAFLAADVNNDYDRLWLATNQQQTAINRSLRLQDDDVAGASPTMELPLKDDRKGKLLGFHATTGEPITAVTINADDYVLKAGDTMTGTLNMGSNKVTSSATPSATSDLTNKQYVDAAAGAVDTLSATLVAGNTTGGNDIAFGDNDKATFGAGPDLEIYSDGSSTQIKEIGPGALILQAANLYIENTNGENQIDALSNGAVKLYHNNNLRLETKAGSVKVTGGLEVTGTVEFAGLTGTGSVSITDILDEDNMSSDSATALATQQSIKAYVDNNAGTAYTAGSGLSLTGTEFANTAPDQTVVMNSGSGISVSGTYPTFTVTNSSPDQTVALTGTGGTTISGTYPNFTINSTDTNTTYTAGTGLTLTSTEFSVTDNGIGALQLNVSGNGTNGQVLASDGDGSFSWTSAGTGGNETLAQTLALGAVTGGTDISVSSGDNIVMAANSTVDGRDLSVDGAKLDLINQGVATTDSPAFAGLTVDTDTLAVDSTNNRVGIGTDSPANTLDVLGDVYSGAFYRDVDVTSVGPAASYIQVGARSGSTRTPAAAFGSVLNNPATTGSAVIQTLSGGSLTERMRIDSSGQVGIGTALPASALDVNGRVTCDDLQVDLGTATATAQITTPSALSGFNAFSIKNTHTEGYLSFGTTLGQARIKAMGVNGSADPLNIDVGSTTAIGIAATGESTFTSEGGITLHTKTNGVGATISFSDHQGGSYAQKGTLTYVHADGSSFGSGNAFVFGSTETTTSVVGNKAVFDNYLVKPASGTGAGSLVIDSSRNITANYMKADRIYANDDGTTGYFFNDSGTRTAYAGGDFYIQSSVGNFYNYATNTYLGNTSGDVIHTRGNRVTGNNFEFTAAGNFYVNAGYGSKQLAYGVRAWARYEMTGTHSFRDDEGFSSVTDIATGRSRLNFTNTMPNTYYSVNVTTGSTSYTSAVCSASVYSLSTTLFYVSVEDLDGGFTDRDQMNVMVVR